MILDRIFDELVVLDVDVRSIDEYCFVCRYLCAVGACLDDICLLVAQTLSESRVLDLIWVLYDTRHYLCVCPIIAREHIHFV